jgi:N-acetylneuraminic acid mutarotase
MKSPGATACQRYRPRERTWNIQAEMPTPRGGAVGVLMPSITTPGILVFGGANEIDIYGYNGFQDRWFLVGEIVAPRNMSFIGVVGQEGDRILLVGGVDETGSVVDTVWIGESVED